MASLAFLFKSLLGTFQVGGMIEVCIRVKEAKQMMSERKAKNLTRLNRVLMFLGIFMFLVAGVLNVLFVYQLYEGVNSD